MNPANPYFYVSTFVPQGSAGDDLPALVANMNDACYGAVFQPERCAILSQMVGRVRQQEACPTYQGVVPHGAMSGSSTLAAAGLASAATTATSPNVLNAALATLGTQSQTSKTSGLALC